MNPIEVTCDSDGSMSVGIKQGFHVYTEEENSKILGVIEYLRAENERLRGVEASNIALRATNDRLRKLAREMWDLVSKADCGWDMGANHCTGSDGCNGECGLWYEMRELGIEVV